MLRVWGLRKAGLSLLSGRRGVAKPIAGVETSRCARSACQIMLRVGEDGKAARLEMSYYGHAASGLLHVRPVVDLHRADSIGKYRVLPRVSPL